MSFVIPKDNQVRCQICPRIVHRSRVFRIEYVWVAKIDSAPTPVKSVKWICVHCLKEYKQSLEEVQS